MNLTKETVEKIIALMNCYPQKRSALIPALQIAQKELGFLPEKIQEEVAKLFNLAASEVRSIVSFYDMFSEEPQEKNEIFLCTNVSCMLRGADLLKDEICKRAKGKYRVHLSECLGACDKAPMMILNEEVIGPLTEEKIDLLFPEVPHG